MDTDSLMTDVVMPTGGQLGELKDEIPRYGGFIHGRFYGPKLYRLAVEPEYLELEQAVRRRMLEKDAKFMADLEKEGREAIAAFESGLESYKKADGTKGRKAFERIKAKGIGKKNRTRDALETLYDGALKRLAYCADPSNRHPDGRLKKMPEELVEAGTIYENRLEKLGTLARMVKRDKKGRIIKKKGANGQLHSVSAAFERGPLVRSVPKRLHLEGAKRIHLGDGRTKPYHIDMLEGGAKREDWS